MSAMESGDAGMLSCACATLYKSDVGDGGGTLSPAGAGGGTTSEGGGGRGAGSDPTRTSSAGVCVGADSPDVGEEEVLSLDGGGVGFSEVSDDGGDAGGVSVVSGVVSGAVSAGGVTGAGS